MADPDRRLRLLLVARELDARGSASLAIDLARSLKARGHSLLFLHAGGDRAIELRKAQIPEAAYDAATPLPLFRVLHRRIAARARAFSPELVHALSLEAFSHAARILPITRRPPLVVTVHGFPKTRVEPIGFDGKPPAAVVAISQAVRESLVNRGGVAWDRVRVIEGGVDIRRVPEVPPLAEPSRDPVVGCVGRFEIWRGQVHLVEAAPKILAHHPTARFVLAGDGPEESSLRRRARDLGVEDRVVFVCGETDWTLLFAEIDVFVSPSIEEGLGQNVLLAMASGKAVVATQVGGVYEIIEEGKTGLMVRPRDPGEIAAAVSNLLSNPESARGLGAAARRAVESRFPLSRMVDETEELYLATV